VTKRLTIFYSWQADTPSTINRNFIEEALTEALKLLQSDAMLELALRDADITLDRDTKGVAGSPPIVETILRKIEECAAFEPSSVRHATMTLKRRLPVQRKTSPGGARTYEQRDIRRVPIRRCAGRPGPVACSTTPNADVLWLIVGAPASVELNTTCSFAARIAVVENM